MKIESLGSNQTEVVTQGACILVSYSTPVAAILWVKGSGNPFPQAYRTSKRWSNTTQRHINQWLANRTAEEKPQSFFDGLLEGGNNS